MKKIFLLVIFIFLLSGCSKITQNPVETVASSASEDSPDSVSESAGNISEIGETSSNTELIFDQFNSEEMILVRDPKNYLKAVFEGNKILISGKKRGENCHFGAYFDVDEPEKIKNLCYFDIESDSENFLAEYDCSELPEGNYTVMIDFIDDKNWIYYELPVCKNADNAAPEDNSDTVKNNSGRANSAIKLSNELTAEYIVPGRDPEEIRRVLTEIKTLSDEICSGINDDYEKLRAISNWVSENIYYDLDALSPGGSPPEILSLDYVLKNKRSLCGGFSNITAALCAAQEIECCNVHGIKLRNAETLESAKSNDPHQCNFAVINNRIIWVDTLWNKGQPQAKYFDISGAFFAYEYKVTFCEFRNYFEVI